MIIVKQVSVGDIAFIAELRKSTRGAGNERLQRSPDKTRLRPDLQLVTAKLPVELMVSWAAK